MSEGLFRNQIAKLSRNVSSKRQVRLALTGKVSPVNLEALSMIQTVKYFVLDHFGYSAPALF